MSVSHMEIVSFANKIAIWRLLKREAMLCGLRRIENQKDTPITSEPSKGNGKNT